MSVVDLLTLFHEMKIKMTHLLFFFSCHCLALSCLCQVCSTKKHLRSISKEEPAMIIIVMHQMCLLHCLSDSRRFTLFFVFSSMTWCLSIFFNSFLDSKIVKVETIFFYAFERKKQTTSCRDTNTHMILVSCLSLPLNERMIESIESNDSFPSDDLGIKVKEEDDERIGLFYGKERKRKRTRHIHSSFYSDHRSD